MIHPATPHRIKKSLSSVSASRSKKFFSSGSGLTITYYWVYYTDPSGGLRVASTQNSKPNSSSVSSVGYATIKNPESGSILNSYPT